MAAIENIGRGGRAPFFLHDHDGNGAPLGRGDLLFDRSSICEGVAEDRIDGAMVIGENFWILGVGDFSEDVGGDASTFDYGVLCFCCEDAEGPDLVAGGVEFEMEID